MKYSELLQNGATPTEIQAFLAEGDTAPVTMRIPSNLRDAAKEAADFERSACEDDEAAQIAEMEAAGMEVTYPDTTEFQEAMAPVYEKYAEQFGQENIDAIVNYEY